MTTIHCEIPEDLASQLTAAADARGVSKSEIVKEALERGLPELTRTAPPALHELMKEACGIVKGGPRDRSWNKKHLEGYGRE